MDKQSLLNEIGEMSAAGLITAEELNAAYARGVATEQIGEKRRVSISDVLYFIGGGIVFLGIVLLVGQNWSSLNSFAKVLITLGSAVAAYIIAALFHRRGNLKLPSTAFFMISGLLFPVGLMVLLNVAGIEWATLGSQTVVAAILLIIFFASGFIFKKSIFLFFSIIFATWLFQVGVLNIFKDSFDNIYAYIVLTNGLAFMLLGKYFSNKVESAFSGPLYGFGSLMFLGAAFILGGTHPNGNVFWQVIFPLLDFGIIFLSVYWRSKTFLVFGSIFLMVYIIKITTEYFSQSLGWPFALVLAGLLLMAIGYMGLYLNRKYLAKRTETPSV